MNEQIIMPYDFTKSIYQVWETKFLKALYKMIKISDASIRLKQFPAELSMINFFMMK